MFNQLTTGGYAHRRGLVTLAQVRRVSNEAADPTCAYATLPYQKTLAAQEKAYPRITETVLPNFDLSSIFSPELIPNSIDTRTPDFPD